TIPVLLIALIPGTPLAVCPNRATARGETGRSVAADTCPRPTAIATDSYQALTWHACRSLRKQQHESAVSQILVAGAHCVGARLRVCPAAAFLLPRRR